MSIGGGLYEHQDPEPDRYGPSGRALITAKGREWAFWAVMAIGLWAAFQGQPATVFLFLGISLIVLSTGFLAREFRSQWRDSKEKGFWS